MEVKRKYGLLRAIGWLVQAIGVILFIAVIIGAIGLLASGDTVLSIVGGISLPLGIIASVQIFVVGSLLTLATDLEYNTRSNTEAIKVLARKIEAMETAPAAPPAVVVAPVAAPEAEAVEVEPPPLMSLHPKRLNRLKLNQSQNRKTAVMLVLTTMLKVSRRRLRNPRQLMKVPNQLQVTMQRKKSRLQNNGAVLHFQTA